MGAVAILLAGCPYDADVEPTGQPSALRPNVVGAWVCDLNDDPSWADLTVGWTQGSSYLLMVRIRRPDEGLAGFQPVRARPLQVGHHEIWSLSAEDSSADAPNGKYLFLRFEEVRAHSLRLAVLGGAAGDMRGHLDESDPDALARFLGNPRETQAEFQLACRR